MSRTANLASALMIFSHRRLVSEAEIPREIDPRILRHFRDESIDQRTAERLGIDCREMRFRQQVANKPRGLTGVHEIIDCTPEAVASLESAQWAA